MKTLQPPDWAAPKGYANGIAARGTLVFVGGQIGWNAQQQFESDDFIAQCAQALVQEAGSLAAFVWRHRPPPERPSPDVGAATSPESVALSKALKKRGWAFVGPTTVYAFMQAMGLVNDHVPSCIVAGRVDQARAMFRVPASDPR